MLHKKKKKNRFVGLIGCVSGVDGIDKLSVFVRVGVRLLSFIKKLVTTLNQKMSLKGHSYFRSNLILLNLFATCIFSAGSDSDRQCCRETQGVAP